MDGWMDVPVESIPIIPAINLCARSPSPLDPDLFRALFVIKCTTFAAAKRDDGEDPTGRTASRRRPGLCVKYHKLLIVFGLAGPEPALTAP